jgi:hypothetical protein
MDKGGVLLPWVFGLSIAGVAIAVVVSANRPAPGISRSPTPTSIAVLPSAPTAVPATPPAFAPVPAPQLHAAPDLAAVPAPSAAAPEPGAQIWECKTNGQRTFSDKPCGEKPVLHEIGPLNIMNPTPTFRAYGPEPSYAVEYSDPSAQEPAEAAYPVPVGYPVVGYPYNNRRRPGHSHRPHPEHHRPTPR